MTTTMLSPDGLVALPEVMREQLRLIPGEDLEVFVDEDEVSIVIRKARPHDDQSWLDLLLACPAPFEIPERDKGPAPPPLKL